MMSLGGGIDIKASFISIRFVGGREGNGGIDGSFTSESNKETLLKEEVI